MRCTKCKNPVRGHIGPCGPGCGMNAEHRDSTSAQTETVTDTTSRGGPPETVINATGRGTPPETVNVSQPLLEQLVKQMSLLTNGLATMADTQKQLLGDLKGRPAQTAQDAADTGHSSAEALARPPSCVRSKAEQAIMNGEFVNLIDFLPDEAPKTPPEAQNKDNKRRRQLTRL